MPQMPDTTTPQQGLDKFWYAMRVLALLITPVALWLTFFAPELDAQADVDCDDFATQAEAQTVLDGTPGDPNRLDDDNDGIACEFLDGGGTEDDGAASDQYDDETQGTVQPQRPVDSNGQPLRRSPNTGGPPLLLVGAGLLAWSAIGVSLLRGRRD